MNPMKAWIVSARLFVIPWMLVNTLYGVVLAGFELSQWILSFGIVTSLLLMAHFINNWRDFVKGVDEVSEAKPYTVASQILPRGFLSVRTMKLSALFFGLLSLSLLMAYGPLRVDVISLYLLGVLMAVSYTDFFKPRGLGEVALFLGHGFGAVSLAYSLIRPIDLTGISAGFLIGMFTGILYSLDQWQDVKTDFVKKASDLAWMIFKANIRISVLWWFAITATLVMQMGFVLMGVLPAVTLIAVFILPVAHVVGILLDYNFQKGILLALLCLWLYPLLQSFGMAFL